MGEPPISMKKFARFLVTLESNCYLCQHKTRNAFDIAVLISLLLTEYTSGFRVELRRDKRGPKPNVDDIISSAGVPCGQLNKRKHQRWRPQQDEQQNYDPNSVCIFLVPCHCGRESRVGLALSDNQPNLLSRLAHDVNITVRDNDQGKQYGENSCYCPQFWGVRSVSNNKPRRGKNEGKHPDEKYAIDTPCNRHNMSVLEDELDGYIALDSHSTHCESCCYDCLYPEPMFSHTKGVGVAFNPQKEYSDIYWVHGKPYKKVGGTERTEKVVGHCSQSWSGINSIQHGRITDHSQQT